MTPTDELKELRERNRALREALNGLLGKLAAFGICPLCRRPHGCHYQDCAVTVAERAALGESE